MSRTWRTYAGNQTREISFPLGGIGTGSIGLAGNGRLVDWEIFNAPNKRSFNGYSHFAVKAEADGRLLDARVLNGDFPSPYMGQPLRGGPLHSGYGYGPENNTMAGMPHFRGHTFQGEFPLAKMTFEDTNFPGTVRLQAFNPFIPLNDADSSLPCALFEVRFDNPLAYPVTYTAALTASNPKAGQRIVNRYAKDEAGLHTLKLGSEAHQADDPSYGDISIATDAGEGVSYQEFWYRGGWCDNLEMYWRDFTEAGPFRNRTYASEQAHHPRHKDNGTLAVRITLAPGASERVRFVLGWHYPNVYNSWNPEPEGRTIWRNYYAGQFVDSAAVASYALSQWDRLLAETEKFHEALFGSTLPEEVLEAVSANLSVLKSPTSLRLTDGSFYGFEGCIEDVGSCEGSCTHVWNYAYAMPFLFPALERSMRDLDFKYNARADGSMAFRLMLPLGRDPGPFRACVDGQMGGVIKAYRDWKISGDDVWLRKNWPAIRQSIEYAWSESNPDKWDADRDGVIEGRQHHTLDMELFGPNAWLTGFYLAALKAASEIAAYLGEEALSAEYGELFRRGKAWTDTHLYNGRYYIQSIDLTDRSLLEQFDTGGSLFGDNAVSAYWNDEAGEIKYQIGEGCGIDQLVAQWHANLCGLGEIFDPEQARHALRELYVSNFKAHMRDEANAWRLFALNDEGGLVICSWPEGSLRPAVPLTYASETMTGFEYQAACHMIQEGMLEEGLQIVRAIRDRYDGEKRNPWNEVECGSNYARSMASYSLLLAYSGFSFDMTKGEIGFRPVTMPEGGFRTFWSIDGAWGTFELTAAQGVLRVIGGSLTLKRLGLPETWRLSTVHAAAEGMKVDLMAADLAEPAICGLAFASPLVLTKDQELTWYEV
ncbi:GH116 family glycosyl-hydrolase [Paenibacillus sp. R14(2021)]|uniref:GH116 family glycosyl-hydrolase n=1 Tax=Paenibacillus sp. R14(2021) TaxID=2859228 RepID=UPI001C61532C|nr:GH116 family glycosyl-hydrolase [Paenibacillus sp. R14(2021)]